MTPFASYVIVAWVVLAVAAFTSFAPRRGLLVILLSGALFLPESGAGVVELGPVKFSKHNAICYALLLAALLFDAERLFALAPRWSDLPAAVWSLCPVVSTMLNDPPPDGSAAIRDALAQCLGQTTQYLVPYLIGRAYFSDLDALRELADATVVAGLVYMPFCLYEVRMSPQLNSMFYGYTQHSFGQTIRFGGYRPMVFMQHGLAVGMFMATATVLASWVRGTDAATGRWRDRSVWAVGVTLVLCKSTGAVALAAVGVGLRLVASRSAGRWGLLLLAAVPPVYCVSRTTGLWSGSELVELTSGNVDQDRAQSLNFRLEQENGLIARALERPAFGWGGWGRNRVTNREGRDASVTDGMWVIFLGTSGIVGLSAFGAMILLPVARYAYRVRPGELTSSRYAAATGCAVAVGLWCVDGLFNAMPNPLFLVMAAGLTGLTSDPRPAKSVEGAAEQQPTQVPG